MGGGSRRRRQGLIRGIEGDTTAVVDIFDIYVHTVEGERYIKTDRSGNIHRQTMTVKEN